MDVSKLSIGKKAPEEVNAFIEIPQGSTTKYELDKESGVLKVDRFLHTNMFFPFNYGFIPTTLAEDGDPLDVLVLSIYPIKPGTVIAVRPIGMLEMEDESGIDTKILSVPVEKVDPKYKGVKDIKDLDKEQLDRIKHFFDHYKDLEPGKWVKTRNFLGKEKAYEAIKKALK
jgi:inorganic pyrophosphatase